jgi:hypothetical protein
MTPIIGPEVGAEALPREGGDGEVLSPQTDGGAVNKLELVVGADT